jgi:hypothetical protein
VPEIVDIVEQLPRDLASKQRRVRPVGAIRYIVVQYDGVAVPAPGKEGRPSYDPVGRYTAQARYHMQRNWNSGDGPKIMGFGLMYHYRVSTDGRVWRTQPEELVTWHAHSANYAGLALCCDLGPGQTPSQEQLRALKELLDWLCHKRPDIPAGRAEVWGHGELQRQGNRTACPGELLEWVQLYRKGLIT